MKARIAATDALDRRQLHSADAARTVAGWLTARVDQTRSQNGRDVQLARDLRSMPVVAAAFGDGRLGRAEVELLVQARTPDVAEVFAEQETWLVSEVADLRVIDANRFLRTWHQAARLLVGSIDPDGQALVQIITRKDRPGMKPDAPRPSVEVICDELTPPSP